MHDNFSIYQWINLIEIKLKKQSEIFYIYEQMLKLTCLWSWAFPTIKPAKAQFTFISIVKHIKLLSYTYAHVALNN